MAVVIENKNRSIATSKVDNNKDHLIFRVYRTDLQLGSYDRNINLFVSESRPNFCFLEFSIPKYYYGNNVYLFYPSSDFQHVLELVENDLIKYFGDFPPIKTWDIFRLDLCYAWKFLDQKTSENVLEVLRSYAFSRKKSHNYDTSIMMTGSTYSVKWYLKKPEYYYHDFLQLLHQHKENYAYEIANVSEGVS